YTGVDLDHIWQSDASEASDWAQPILQRLRDTYGEGSPSDRGYKVWVRARAPRCGRWLVEGGAVEVYDRDRFFTVTGRSNGVTTITDHQHDIERLVASLDRLTGRSWASGGYKPASAIGQKIPQGQRHPTLVSIAGSLWRRGLDPEEIEITLLTVNQ